MLPVVTAISTVLNVSSASGFDVLSEKIGEPLPKSRRH